VRRELRVAAASLRRRPLLALIGWSIPEALPQAISGIVVAKAVDDGFLADRIWVGLAWLDLLLIAAALSAFGSRRGYHRLGDLVEPFRDDLVRRVVGGALRNGVAGSADDGAVARLTRQIEIVRDTYAGLLVVIRTFALTVFGVVVGLLTLEPVMGLLMLPPFLLGLALFVATLGVSANLYRAAVRADERLAAAAGGVMGGLRDLVARGAEERAAQMVDGPIADQAAAERGLAKVTALRTLCFAIGGWGPLAVLLVLGPWLVDRGLSAGAIMGGLTYVLIGLQPALRQLVSGLGGAGLRFIVTLGRILDASETPPPRPRWVTSTAGHDLAVRHLTFAYGPHAEPVLRDLDLVVPEGDHLAIVGPSGIGKSTLAGLLCGLLRADVGTVQLGGAPVGELPLDRAARARVLIPQEAYVFAGSVWDNLAYLRPTASPHQVEEAVAAVGAKELVARLGGFGAELDPAELSAGERQLIALARAYVSSAPLVVLDEATCFLDPVAERVAEEAFAARPGTLIVIAHRVSSALRARRVLVLDGVSAAEGDHLTLLETSPLYRELLGHWGGEAAPIPAPTPSGNGAGSLDAGWTRSRGLNAAMKVGRGLSLFSHIRRR
jgi:ATP-binding cassette, subfamily B, bacterial RamB/AmfA